MQENGRVFVIFLENPEDPDRNANPEGIEEQPLNRPKKEQHRR